YSLTLLSHISVSAWLWHSNGTSYCRGRPRDQLYGRDGPNSRGRRFYEDTLWLQRSWGDLRDGISYWDRSYLSFAYQLQLLVLPLFRDSIEAPNSSLGG